MTKDIVKATPVDLDKGHTYHVHFILDRSGSMSGKEADVIGGFNSFIQTLRNAEDLPECFVSVTRFDTDIETIWNNLALANVPKMTKKHYQPRGSTALRDAFGQTVSAIDVNPDHRYLVITHTDGQENASHEWTMEKVKELVAKLEAAGNFAFAYFGENQDAWANYAHSGMATNRGQTMSYATKDIHSTHAASSRVSAMYMVRGMSSTKHYGSATAAASAKPDISDDELFKILRGEEDKNDETVTEDSKGGK